MRLNVASVQLYSRPTPESLPTYTSSPLPAVSGGLLTGFFFQTSILSPVSPFVESSYLLRLIDLLGPTQFHLISSSDVLI